jgi:hypothetical protein
VAGRMSAPFMVLHDPALVARIADQPWEVARALGGAISMIERQPIRDVGGRSFASNNRFTPLHTDSQLYRGKPAHWQVLGCVRAARRGGESLVADLHAVLPTLPTSLLDALFATPRTFPFVFGDLVCTTISAVENDLVFTHSPRLDAIGEALLPYLKPQTIALRDGDILIVDNHRCAHGRTAFEDSSRELQRILVWLDEPPPAPEWIARARREGWAPERITDRNVGEIDPQLRVRLVKEMARGVPPGVLAQRHSIPEPWLYAFRDRYEPV